MCLNHDSLFRNTGFLSALWFLFKHILGVLGQVKLSILQQTPQGLKQIISFSWSLIRPGVRVNNLILCLKQNIVNILYMACRNSYQFLSPEKEKTPFNCFIRCFTSLCIEYALFLLLLSGTCSTTGSCWAGCVAENKWYVIHISYF